ncbi:tRNA (adenosine(37)-N6)-threonylcarbamoyltransferase complex dimerization subunit type 1 TsaB [bacterium]|nr:tRNA (adenosine(37)-N6)-threonylcarbamoyltransferase complex dimerization subunit type 1 TsaB [bacterium]
MNVLGIETATEVCSTGLSNENSIIADYRLNRGYTHAEMLPGAVKHIMKQSNISMKDLDAIAVSIGPGSFTGLRIGIGFAKGLAKGCNIPLIGVPTLDALVKQLPFAAEFAATILKSRKGEYYRAVYRNENNAWILKTKYETLPEKDIHKGLPADKSIIITGDINGFLRSQIKNYIKSAIFANYDYFMPNGSSVSSEGIKKLSKGTNSVEDSVTPIYLNKYLGAL